MIEEGTRVRTKHRGLRMRIPIEGSRVMIQLGRIRCRGLLRPNNLGIVLQVSRQAIAEGEGRDGCRLV